jgi:hypothetical protein
MGSIPATLHVGCDVIAWHESSTVGNAMSREVDPAYAGSTLVWARRSVARGVLLKSGARRGIVEGTRSHKGLRLEPCAVRA